MSKRKGVTAEEKRTRMLQLFYEKKTFFQMKELEKIAPKEKGIIAQSVKDVEQALVDDELVDSDRIGTSVYYWAYPSKAKNSRKRTLEELTEKYEKVSKKLKTNREELMEVGTSEEETKETSDMMTEIAELKTRKAELEKKLQQHEDNDPEVLEKMKKDVEALKEATNRWTDNIFNVKKWCKNKFMIEESVLNKQFGIPEELDYVS